VLNPQVFSCRDLEEAAKVYSLEKPQLIICDFKLGQQKATKFLEQVLADNTDCIVITGQSINHELERLQEKGAVVLEKPVSRANLKRVIAGLCSAKKPVSEAAEAIH